MPVPDSDTLIGVLVALVATLNFAVLLNAAFGVNLTLIVHEAPAVRLMPVTANCATPSLRSVATIAPLVWQTGTLPKLSLVGLTTAAGTTFNRRDLVVVLASPVIIALVLLRTGFVTTVNVCDLSP